MGCLVFEVKSQVLTIYSWYATASDKNPCVPNPCKNGGLCKPDGNKFICECTGGHTGDKCQDRKYTY